jgi:mono/diheme cytochrome c family protein
MFRTRFRTAMIVAAALAGGLSAAPAAAAITKEQQQQATEIEGKLTEAGKLLVKNQNDEAAKLVIEAQNDIAELAAGGKGTDFDKLLAKLKANLNVRRRVLESKGVKLPAAPELSKKKGPAAAQVSFTKQIVPILLTNCRNCHVNRASGMFSMASYASLMNGKGGASVIEKGDAKKSPLIEVLEKGEMPQNGRKLPDEQIALISTWINQGARFDGENANAPIAAGQPAAKGPKLEVTKASGRESIKFSRDIAPVLVAQCVDCHGGQQPRAQLGMDTFARLLRGSQNGVILTPGKPDDSMIVKKLKGTGGGQRMPAGRPPLSNDVIAKFEKWIAEGAKFDGPSPDTETEMVAKIYAVSQMSHAELTKERISMATANWKLANPEDKPTQHETTNFLLVGNVGQDRLKEIGEAAEKIQGRIAAIFGATAGQPLIKGRLTLFVFNKRFDYSEYRQMVEKRSTPSDWSGHWRYTIVDAYACIHPPETDRDGTLEALLAEQLAGAYVETLGAVPSWFAQGTAWEVAARLGKKDPRVAQWNDRLPEVLSQMTKGDDFLTGKLSAGDAAVANYAFVKSLMSKQAPYRAVLSAVKKGTEFKQAFVSVYRAEPNQIAEQWARTAVRKK